MTTIDNIMALAYKLRYARTYELDVSDAVEEAGQELRTALTEALAAQPVREPLTIQHLREIERNHVYNHTATLIEFARRIERYHGIGCDT